jgi:hypothetical protein
MFDFSLMDFFFWLLKFLFFVFGTVVGLSILVATVGHLWAAGIEQQAHIEELREKVAVYARLATSLAGRLDSRKDSASSAAAALFSIQRQETALKRKVRELETARFRFVRVLGKEQTPNKPYEFMVMNTSVAHQVKRGEKHPFYDNSWAASQPVQVWGPSLEDAKAELERAYPVTVGFKITHVELVPSKTTAMSAANHDSQMAAAQ